MKKVLGIIVALGFLATPVAFAGADGPGCGVGQMLFQGQKGLGPHLLGYTTNGTFSNSFAMSSGTSGCDTSATVQAERDRMFFVRSNQDALSLQIAQGGGAYLDSFALLMGCGAVKTTFAKATQDKYAVIFSADQGDTAAVLDSVRQVIRDTPELTDGCKVS